MHAHHVRLVRVNGEGRRIGAADRDAAKRILPRVTLARVPGEFVLGETDEMPCCDPP